MPDNLSPEDRRKTMRAVVSKGTGLERKLFAMLSGMRLQGWRKNVDTVQGKPDVVFEDERVAIFVHGCFWHSCPQCLRKLPKTNSEYWRLKIARNAERDRRNRQILEENGWQVLTIWEHEFKEESSRKKIRAEIRRMLAKEQ
ncbi:MAG: Very short patch repair protein [Chloroflexi bacterium ADurb.Bin325]|nr:MAG: Very short patch repair protein [Chloroflexi bacterium ADurb.Bin325]